MFGDRALLGADVPNQWYLLISTDDLVQQFRRFLESKSKRILTLAARREILHSKDASALGVPRNYLSRLVEKGALKKLGRGLYALTAKAPSKYLPLLRVSYRVPNGVICLMSSLQFHNLAKRAPNHVWIAIAVKAWTPTVSSPATRFVRMSGRALTFEAKNYRVPGGKLRVYTPAKTVVDCFKFRNKVGIGVAVAALKECKRLKKASLPEIHAAAEICRVSSVMRPYLESLW
jgi:predicted transcriptional regulator of viral defense system